MKRQGLLLHLGCTAVLIALARVTAMSTGTERCYLEMAVGNCDEQVQRWYFDNRTGLCQPFTYTGCGGNGNNFNSTAYCYHACNVTHHHDGHSYSIEDTAKKLKGKGQVQNGQQDTGGSAATTPTDFSKQRPHLQTTRQPTLIRNAPVSGTGQRQRARQPAAQTTTDDRQSQPKRRRRAVREPHRRRLTTVDLLDEDDDVSPEEEEFTGESARWKYDYSRKRDLNAKRYDAGRPLADRYTDRQLNEYGSEYSYYGDNGRRGYDRVGNSFRSRGGSRGGVAVVGELLAQLQRTATLLERLVVMATANERSAPSRRRPSPKNADEDSQVRAASTAEETPRTVADHHRRRLTPVGETRAVGSGSGRRPGKNARRRGGDKGRRLLHVTLLGRLERLPATVGDRRAVKLPEIGAARKSRTDTTRKHTNAQNDDNGIELERERHLQANTPQTSHDNEDRKEDDDDIEVMSDRIHAIITDPESSFAYDNISADDMVSLEEMLSQSSAFGTMKLVEKDADEDEEAAKKNSVGTTAETVTKPVNRDGGGEVMEKPSDRVAEADSGPAAASETAEGNSAPKAP